MYGYELNTGIENLNLFNIFTSNTRYIFDALSIIVTDPYHTTNAPCIVDRSVTGNMPTDCAWGIRMVYWVNLNSVIVQIIGITIEGTAVSIWLNGYNQDHWIGWKKMGS